MGCAWDRSRRAFRGPEGAIPIALARAPASCPLQVVGRWLHAVVLGAARKELSVEDPSRDDDSNVCFVLSESIVDLRCVCVWL